MGFPMGHRPGVFSALLEPGSHFVLWLCYGIQVKHKICSLLSSFRCWPEQVSPGAGSGPRASQEAPGSSVCPRVQRGWLLYPGEALAESPRLFPGLRPRGWGAAEQGKALQALAFWETAEASLTPSMLPSGAYVSPPGPSTLSPASWQWGLKRHIQV